MKILYVESNIDGHHENYLKALCMENKYTSIVIVPERVVSIQNKQYVLQLNSKKRSFCEYRKWLKKIYQIAHSEQVDVIHFLYGDVLYRYFGIGLRQKKWSIVVTFHHIRRGKLRDFSLERIFRRIRYGIVHTDSLLEDLNSMKIKNCVKIEYPKFGEIVLYEKRTCRLHYLIPQNSFVFLALGGTRYDKGLDILLEAFNKLNNDTVLFIAGESDYFDADFIQSHLSENAEKRVRLLLKNLTSEEWNEVISASDAIVLPYRCCFDGASGPLVDGVTRQKVIIGPSHGSLGKIIKDYHLGYTFKSEDSVSLAKALLDTSREKYVQDSIAQDYVKQLNVKCFIENNYYIYNEINKEISNGRI